MVCRSELGVAFNDNRVKWSVDSSELCIAFYDRVLHFMTMKSNGLFIVLNCVLYLITIMSTDCR